MIYVLTLSLYDLRMRRIPNWATFPLILAGLAAHFPGYPDIRIGSIGLFLVWASGWMGAGDAKLWIALLWALPLKTIAHIHVVGAGAGRLAQAYQVQEANPDRHGGDSAPAHDACWA